MEFKHRKVRVRHTISVESCIADEIRDLNNKHNIVTLYSCCGHKVGPPWVKVKSDDIEKMRLLGYKELGTEQVWVYKVATKGLRRVQTAVERVFVLRSKCKCKKAGDRRRVVKW